MATQTPHPQTSISAHHSEPLPLPLSLSVVSSLANDDGPLPDELIRHVVATAGAAPSVHNTQPWLFRWDGYVLDLYADRRRQLHRADPAGRLLAISCGAALHHAQLAVRGLGRDAQVQLLPGGSQDDHLARLIPGTGKPHLPTHNEWALLQAVGERRTYRDAFEPHRLSRGLLIELEQTVAHSGCGLRLVERPGEREEVAELIMSAALHLEQDPIAQEELKTWSRWEDDLNSGLPIVDGIPRSSIGHPDRDAVHPAFTQRDFRVDGDAGPDATSSAEHEPVAPEDPDVAAIWTVADTTLDWLTAGMALSALLLTATCAGAAASLLNQPLEEPVLRTRLHDALRVPGPVQLLLRLGYSEMAARAPMTPRRPVKDFLTIRGDADPAVQLPPHLWPPA